MKNLNNEVEQFSDYGVRKWDSMTCKISGVYIEGTIKTLTENGITIVPNEVNFSSVKFDDSGEKILVEKEHTNLFFPKEIEIDKEDFDKVELEIFTYHRGNDHSSIGCLPYADEWRRSWF